MAMLGTQEILLLLLLFFLLFGVERLPKMARALGLAKGEFQKGLMDGSRADGSIETETDLDRGGRTAAAELAEKAESAGIDIEGKTPDEVEEELDGDE